MVVVMQVKLIPISLLKHARFLCTIAALKTEYFVFDV
jgi:hypothetical protein